MVTVCLFAKVTKKAVCPQVNPAEKQTKDGRRKRSAAFNVCPLMKIWRSRHRRWFRFKVDKRVRAFLFEDSISDRGY